MDEKNPKLGRRRIITAAVAGGAIGAVTLPEKWVKPVIQSVIVPAHAATSPLPTSTTPVPTTTVLVTTTTAAPTTTVIVSTTTPSPTTTLLVTTTTPAPSTTTSS